VGEHRAEGAVTDDADVRDLGAVLLVDHETATVVGLKTDLLETETGGVGTAADGNKADISVESLGLAALGSLNLKLDALATVVTADDLGVELELHALLAEGLLDVLGDLSVHTGATDLAEELDNGDLRAQAGPDGGHLETNDTTTNDDHLLGDLSKGNGAGRGDDLLLVDVEAGEGSGLGAGCDKDVLAADGGLATLGEVDGDGVLIGEGAGALDVLDVVLLEQELDTLGQAVDGGLLCLHHLAQVELDAFNLDTAALGVVHDLVVEMRVVEERF